MKEPTFEFDPSAMFLENIQYYASEPGVHSASAARKFDQITIENFHIPSLVLMENAARGMADRIIANYPKAKKIAVLCGPGNNGGDGLALARILYLKGYRVAILLKADSALSDDETVQFESCLALNIQLYPLELFVEDYRPFDESYDLYVDALFGSGLNRPLGGIYKEAVCALNRSIKPVVSCDIPSGIYGNTGQGETFVYADLTLALDCRKFGHIISKGHQASKTVEVIDIGIPAAVHALDPGQIKWINKKSAVHGLPVRSRYLNKGRFGKVLLCGGSFRMQGALAMAASSCFHAGVGTLSLYTPKSAAQAIAAKMDLAMIIPADETDGYFSEQAADRLTDLLDQYTFVCCGNGMGTEDGALKVVHTLLKKRMNMILDADAINIVSRHPEWLKINSEFRTLILTPHVVEFSRLSGFTVEQIQNSPIECIDAFLREYPNIILVLKSDVTFVADAENISVLDHPDSTLSKGGSGDVLAGLICGLCAQQSVFYEACASAVWIHNQAASYHQNNQDRINPACFTPLDLIENYSSIFNELEKVREHCA